MKMMIIFALIMVLVGKIFGDIDISWTTITLVFIILLQRDSDLKDIDNAIRRNYGKFVDLKQETEDNKKSTEQEIDDIKSDLIEKKDKNER